MIAVFEVDGYARRGRGVRTGDAPFLTGSEQAFLYLSADVEQDSRDQLACSTSDEWTCDQGCGGAS